VTAGLCTNFGGLEQQGKLDAQRARNMLEWWKEHLVDANNYRDMRCIQRERNVSPIRGRKEWSKFDDDEIVEATAWARTLLPSRSQVNAAFFENLGGRVKLHLIHSLSASGQCLLVWGSELDRDHPIINREMGKSPGRAPPASSATNVCGCRRGAF
jgi:hypothetical protein